MSVCIHLDFFKDCTKVAFVLMAEMGSAPSVTLPGPGLVWDARGPAHADEHSWRPERTVEKKPHSEARPRVAYKLETQCLL